MALPRGISRIAQGARRTADRLDQRAVETVDTPIANRIPDEQNRAVALREDEAIARNIRTSSHSDEQVLFEPLHVNDREGVAVARQTDEGVSMRYWDGDSEVYRGASLDDAQGTVRGSGRTRGETDVGATDSVSRRTNRYDISPEDVSRVRRQATRTLGTTLGGYAAVNAIERGQDRLEEDYGIDTPRITNLPAVARTLFSLALSAPQRLTELPNRLRERRQRI